jgi:hypothetical protein
MSADSCFYQVSASRRRRSSSYTGQEASQVTQYVEGATAVGHLQATNDGHDPGTASCDLAICSNMHVQQQQHSLATSTEASYIIHSNAKAAELSVWYWQHQHHCPALHNPGVWY